MQRLFIAVMLVIVLALGSDRTALAVTNPITTGSTPISLEPFVTIPGAQGAPMDLTHAHDGSGRTFIAARNGFVRLVDNTGTLQTTPYLDFAARGVTVLTASERGFLGMAFHPDFAVVGSPGFGKFYTHTSEARVGTPTFNHPELGTTLGDHHAVIREWTANPADSSITTASRILMRINQPESNHNGGALAFGPDKNLYIALGDGGGANDGVNSSSTSNGHTNGTGNAQDTSNVYGSVLRINPLGNNSANGQYGIPATNPFVGQAGVDEIYAYGLRNPWKMSFDRATGALYTGDVGQGAREEVNIITSGGNYGWVYREGSIATPTVSVTPPVGATFMDPIAEYINRNQSGGDGDAIIGGFVYRGAVEELQGQYIFGDLHGKSGFTAGRLFHTDAAGGTIFEFPLAPGSLGIPGALHGFGEDQSGHLYVYFGTGQVYRLVPEPASGALLLAAALLLRRRRLPRAVC